jgi:hydrogenase maturation protein HypF
MKGLGGYHLICDATSESAVTTLRQRKTREEKPFAVMVRDIESAKKWCTVSGAERQLLTSFRRPIVLLRKQEVDGLAMDLAPKNPFLGIMLPYTPLHHLLLQGMSCTPLVMTSGNRSDEPIAIDETDAIDRLNGIADMFLVHNRPIHVRCDDSVTRVIGGKESPIRRSRGYAPEPIHLSLSCAQPILAVGGQMKGTFALAAEQRAILSHHLGDLDHLQAYRAFERDIRLYQELFSIQAACIAHDLHPDYASTRYAIQRAAEENLPAIAVQHHHAHMASCMAEHGLSGPVIGVTLDGTGYGTDGAIWGGEFLVGDYHTFQRAAHLRYVGLPGGEQAVREPWRIAAAHLTDAQMECKTWEARQSQSALTTIRSMIKRKFNTPLTSSAGRLFDAVSSLIGVRDQVSYEGQAAIELEALASDAEPTAIYPFAIDKAFVIDTRPLIAAIAGDVDSKVAAATIASQFHSTLAKIIRDVCLQLRVRTGIDSIVLSGGVWMNAMLTLQVEKRLSTDKFRVFRHHRVPPNDGGLSLGQIAVAAAKLNQAQLNKGGLKH